MKRKRLSQDAYVAGIRAGNRRVLSQAITLIESKLATDRELAAKVIAACLPHTGGAFRIGITGSPGVGKSTFIDSFGTFLTELSLSVAVLAVDPSSQRTRGSILGDKTRMERLSRNERAFVRPSPAGSSLGGVAAHTRESLLLCEAAGFDCIIVETVGVGQSEIAVHSMVDFFLLLILPNAGDELQGIKKGIVEMADGLAVNKADGAYLNPARAAKASFSQALRLFPKDESGWKPRVLTCSALENQGIAEIWDMLQGYRQEMQASGYWTEKRSQQAVRWMEDRIRDRITDSFFGREDLRDLLDTYRAEVADNQRSPIQAADLLVKQWEESSGVGETGNSR